MSKFYARRPRQRTSRRSAGLARHRRAAQRPRPPRPPSPTPVSAATARTYLGRADRDGRGLVHRLQPRHVPALDHQSAAPATPARRSSSATARTSSADSGCAATSGSWYSPYDGATWTAASDVDIDHMVPLAEAWSSGASSWTTAQRQAFANDLTRPQLIAVTDNVNQSKGDQDPAKWLPLAHRRTAARTPRLGAR